MKNKENNRILSALGVVGKQVSLIVVIALILATIPGAFRLRATGDCKRNYGRVDPGYRRHDPLGDTLISPALQSA